LRSVAEIGLTDKAPARFFTAPAMPGLVEQASGRPAARGCLQSPARLVKYAGPRRFPRGDQL